MTALTILSEYPVMNILLPMAGVTSHRCLLFVQFCLVATFAFDPTMFSKKRKFGIATMIECDLIPKHVGMTIFAFRAERAGMFIVFLMTAVAVERRRLVPLIRMTISTTHDSMLAADRKFCLVMIEPVDILPFHFCMA